MTRQPMHGLSLCSWNANGIINKISEFRLFVEKYGPDIILIQETQEKISKFTDAVRSTHNLSSKPIANKHHSYTPQHIKDLIRHKNRARKQFQRALNPLHKAEANRLQVLIKKELKLHTENTWNTKFASLNTQDNSLWCTQKYIRKTRSAIPNLNSSSGIANNDEQKANLIANSFEDNYTENKRPGSFKTNIDSDVYSTLENFFASAPRFLLLTR
ncbi:hypothetical protein TNCV_3864771 [Trichonephila clavipes]|nr:hypothetical protein TNCV_3864771 [Trichonephila clavipes]